MPEFVRAETMRCLPFTQKLRLPNLALWYVKECHIEVRPIKQNESSFISYSLQNLIVITYRTNEIVKT
jgi:hypothetical protein